MVLSNAVFLLLSLIAWGLIELFFWTSFDTLFRRRLQRYNQKLTLVHLMLTLPVVLIGCYLLIILAYR